KIRQRRKLVQSGDLEHGAGLSARAALRNPCVAATRAARFRALLRCFWYAKKTPRRSDVRPAEKRQRETLWHEEFSSRRPLHGPRPERHGRDLASAGGADRDRGSEGGGHRC